ncbi:MAG: ATP-binding protein [Bacteroidetes bacterium]|jgi:uncharacterized protein|nr:ATP-binding protein [Bacteroidota bacterium]MBT6685313.1 ATP-binding protein [Bacteroidota bacterium]MBT7142871.1 ATP-binding protein [Bacteroidota bacterium]MBT7490352.1 ATP-binding protein [Bacteroidota bacterium]
MKRFELQNLINWKNSSTRKPLIIKGARQVGKTWLMKEFGNKHYAQTVYINFEKSNRLKPLFIDDFDIRRVIVALEIETGLTIKSNNTLLIFDEIQALPEAITALKYFYEEAPQYHILAAGSLLGVALHTHVSFPVGKVDFLYLFPLSFIEFLDALNESVLIKILQEQDWKLITTFKNKYIERLRQYYFVGGMPEAVLSFSNNNNYSEVRYIQKQILTAYEYDFSKHAPNEIVHRIRMLWNSIPAQLAKENRKFIYGIIKSGARAKDYELALSWLSDCGLIHKIYLANKPAIPIKAYEERSAFKLFLVDIGLLAAMGNIDKKTLLEGNTIFTEFKGAITEQYVLQQLISNDFTTYYWSAKHASSEIDFLIQFSGEIYPIEVKANENLQAKSLKVYNKKFGPSICIRTSLSNYRVQDWMINLPLYAVNELQRLLVSICP